jgi:hypothetical protein
MTIGSISVVWKRHTDLLVLSPTEVTAQRGHVAQLECIG